jgi:hypothetical protein
VLLDRGRRELAAQLLDIGGDDERLQLLEPEASAVAPGEEPPRGAAIGAAGVGLRILAAK